MRHSGIILVQGQMVDNPVSDETQIAVMERDIKHIRSALDELCRKYEGREKYWRNTILSIMVFVLTQLLFTLGTGAKIASEWGHMSARVEFLEHEAMKGQRFTKEDGFSIIKRVDIIEHHIDEMESRLDRNDIKR